MAKGKSIAAYADRVLGQVSQANTEQTDSAEEKSQDHVLPMEEAQVQESSKRAPKVQDRPQTSKLQQRRRSPWVNPYPDAETYHTSDYRRHEDAERIKNLRLKLRFVRDWMVTAYALERLEKDFDDGKIPPLEIKQQP